jgi:hypothetical protein
MKLRWRDREGFIAAVEQLGKWPCGCGYFDLRRVHFLIGDVEVMSSVSICV